MRVESLPTQTVALQVTLQGLLAPGSDRLPIGTRERWLRALGLYFSFPLINNTRNIKIIKPNAAALKTSAIAVYFAKEIRA